MENLEFGIIDEISFSRYEHLKCPLRYYVTYYLGLRSYSLVNIIGLIVHKIYEDKINAIVLDDCEDIIVDKEYVKNIVKEITEKFNFDQYIDYDKILKTVNKHIHNKLLDYIKEHLKKGYDVDVEYKSRLVNQKINIIDQHVGIYIRPDIIIYNDKKIKIIDIKTGKIRFDNKVQLLLYSHVLLNNDFPSHNVCKGLVYSSKYNNLTSLFFYDRFKIEKMVNEYFEKITKAYQLLNIKSSQEIESFVKSLLEKTPDELVEIRSILFSIFSTTVCKYCLIYPFCPIIKKKLMKEFRALIEEKTISNRYVTFQTAFFHEPEIIIDKI